MPTIDVNLTKDEIEFLEYALYSYAYSIDAAKAAVDQLAETALPLEEVNSHKEQINNINRQQKKRLTFVKGKLTQAKIRLRVEEAAKSSR